MRVNHASTLSVDYFVSYLNLIMVSREVTLKDVALYMKKEFFKGETDMYGKVTETHFNLVIQKLKQK
ncbi:hypothetical protein [Staphylococcus chromogenes]|uniref:hypothetical protein n=1 Tax=Staphylococcus chromogenes TaxID=46126 RepID=UPI000D1A421F|nr:hypothetical protein [Staphylococcus chromogenes]MDT0655966.1 hypothetical protein [Staphylococcus chromogenes]MDT0680742.1 hypothetical protein [Staphylococcus chromogenes]MDU0476887.1 hypothetical protein [Staphylococcus chromogenes]MEB7450489.1 hypothetical protein [Staphylococcus chromogenes]PTF98644.1 hypothetical protein BU663_10200 [Staphylococcus chromogenes]